MFNKRDYEELIVSEMDDNDNENIDVNKNDSGIVIKVKRPETSKGERTKGRDDKKRKN